MSLYLKRHYGAAADTNIFKSDSPGKKEKATLQDQLLNVLKLVPAEVVVAYPLLKSLLGAVPDLKDNSVSIAALIVVLLTGFIRFVLMQPPLRPQPLAAAISTLACIVWVYSLGDQIFWALPPGYEPVASVAVVIISVIGPYLVLGKDEGDTPPAGDK